MRAQLALALGLLAAASPALANGKLPWRKDLKDIELVTQPVIEHPPARAGTISHTIFLERCKGGCTVHKGANDARAYTSTIPDGDGDFMLGEFQNAAGQTGAMADEEWGMLVKCVQEVYSPFDVQVTDVKPDSSVPTYHMNIVAGLPRDVNLPSSVGGVSPGVGCDPINNWITYSFANLWDGTPTTRTWTLCGVVAQESAHSFGLDHAWAHSDGTSSCNDPMTYRNDCGGQQFFRNDQMSCGEYSSRACMCGGFQNPHLSLLNTFGPGTPITAAPTVTLSVPAPGSTTVSNGANFAVTASAQRGIKTVELWINGYKWGETKGAGWGPNGQPSTAYSIALPASVPDGVMDVVMKAKDDIDVSGEAAITVTKGAPCADASACASGQKCEAGKCFWDPAAGALGDSCGYDQFCLSGLCAGTSADEKFCTRECVVDSADSCPDGLKCAEGNTIGKGYCVPDSGGGGGCATSDDSTPYAALMLGLFGVGIVVLRRRR